MKLRDFLTKKELFSGSADTLVFDKGIPRGPFKRFNFVSTPSPGTHNGMAGDGILKYVLKLDNDEIWNLKPAQLRALLEAFISPIGGVVPDATATRYTFPFDAYVETGALGLPDQGPVTVEIEVDDNTEAGELRLSYEMWDKKNPPSAYLKMLREPMLAPAGSSGFPYYINEHDEPILGFILPLVADGITELWLYRSPEDGKPAEELLHYRDASELLESQAHYNPETITNPFFWKPFPTPINYPRGSYIRVATDIGTDEDDEIVPVILKSAKK